MAETRDLGLFIPPEKLADLEEERRLESDRKGRIKRRLALRWAGWIGVMAVAGQWAVGFLGFFWPQKLGAFGGNITAGNVADFKVGSVTLVREGKFYLTHVPEGFLALWWKCPHLGCTVPWKDADPVQGGPPGDGDKPFAAAGSFHCPCHGSIYNRYGQIVSGPAPRPMDRFPITIDPSGKISVQTGPTVAITRQAASIADVAAPPA